ncbi:MAG: response regulator [bacterium]|nr:response regulator [bacterium]
MTAPKRILVVDDDHRTRQVLRTMVENMGHQVEEARDGFDALAQLRLGVDLVLLDIVMPGIDGFEVVRQIRQDPETKEIPVIMVTALSEREDRIRAIQMGANDFISKPVDILELQLRTSFLIQMKEAQDEIKRNRIELEEQLDQRTGALRKAVQDMASAQRKAHSAHLETIQRLAIAAEYKDKDTAAHIKRLGHYCAAIARHVGLSPNEIETIFHASPMHDVGKLGIPDDQLLKADKLDQDEWKIMKKHTIIGARILEGSGSELLQAGEEIALSHHERWDGSGYPFGRAGDEIPVMGRVCTVADVFDALTSKRPYKKAFSNRDTFELMREGRGTHFDPRVLDAFFDHLPEMEEIQKKFRDEAAFSEMEK